MCGIIGYIGKNDAIKKTIESLKTLEYRGYDSAGITYIENEKKVTIKEIGKIINLEQKLNYNIKSDLAIAHTRWATHGVPSITNAHPHTVGAITIVHNGIIENYATLKEEMKQKGYTFQSDTDTEVAAAVIDNIYKEEKDIITTLNKVENILRGSYAIALILDGDYNNLYALRKDSPLIIGLGTGENYIASDVPAILKYTNKYILLDNNDVARLTRDKVTVYNNMKEVPKEIKTYTHKSEEIEKQGYSHYMLKEIHEEPTKIQNLIDKYIINGKIAELPNFKNYSKIHIVACGSAYHAGLVGKHLIELYGNLPVTCEIASEYRYKNNFIDENTLVIAISQSGETADTLASIRLAKEHKAHTLGIINVKESSIAREVDNVIYVEAGPEIAVATTKAYTLQVLILSLIAYSLGIENNTLNKEEVEQAYLKLPSLIEKEINKDYKSLAKTIYKKEDIYFLGRKIDYAISMEGALKLKEISYIHCEAYPAGELKHGSISLIEQDTPVITIVTDDTIKEKTVSNIKEVKARGAYNIIITNSILENDQDYADQEIQIDKIHPLLSPILAIIPLQLLSFEIALLRGCDIDKPRNLAKSVTVE